MKKFTAMALALALMLTLFAGCGKAKPAETVPAQELPASALEILENVWAKYEDSEKFSIIGGNIETCNNSPHHSPHKPCNNSHQDYAYRNILPIS